MSGPLARSSARFPDPAELILSALAVGCVAFAGMMLSHWAGGLPTMWPANGVLLAILLTARPATWTSFLAVGFAVDFACALSTGFPLLVGFRIGLTSFAEVTFAVLLVKRYVGPAPDLSLPSELWRFTLIAGLLAPVFAATLNIWLIALSQGNATLANFLASLLAHILGIVTAAPIALAIRRNELAGLFNRQKAVRTISALALLVGVTALVFIQSRYPLLFLVYPPLVLVVSLQGLSGGALGLFMATVVAICFTVAGTGPTTLVSASTVLERIIVIQGFSVVASVLVLVLSAAMAERDRAQKHLEAVKEELAQLATTDGLTGLANRRRLDQVLAEECRRAARDRAPLSLLMLDVDYFKAFNDRYGHQAGDDCLQRIASTVKSFARRPADLAARYGGEEMAIVQPATDEPGARANGEALRAAIQALAIPHPHNKDNGGVVTVSIGIATAGSSTEDYNPEHLISAADALLYEAKRTGRNRVLSAANRPADPLPPSLPDEESRLATVDHYKAIAMADPSDKLDQIAKQAADLLGAPIGLVSLVGRDRQVFVGRYGVEAEGTSREDSFCAHAIAGASPMVVENAETDPRFKDNPLVTNGLGIRFYAGAPLISTPEGHRLGAVCVIDTKPRPTLDGKQREQLSDLAALAMESIRTT